MANEAYRFDDDIPLPPPRHCEGAIVKVAMLQQMQVGQSILLALEKRGGLNNILSVYGKKWGRRFSYRKRSNQVDGEDGFRVWRIE